MIYTRRYVQYNDLPFDSYEMLRSWDDTSVKFKQDSSSYSFRHGSYVAFKSETMLVDTANVSMSILLGLYRLPCDKRTTYRKLVLDEISKPGKLWAVENGELVWAYAYPENYSEASKTSIADSILIDVDFVLYEGIWHKANVYTTYLEKYDLCVEIEEKTTYDPCDDLTKNCCIDCAPPLKQTNGTCKNGKCGCGGRIESDCGCDCDKERKNLCEADINSIFQSLEKCSTTGYKIIEDCSAYERENDEPIGQRFRAESCQNYLSGRIYANTDVPTTDYEIVVVGIFHNLYVEVNGNGNIIEGDYEGKLMIRGDGTAWLYNGDCGWEQLPVSAILIPDGMTLGYTFNPGWNYFKIDAGTCDCNHALTAYITIDNITY